MSDPIHSVLHALGHESQKLRKEGKHGKANGLVFIAVGIFLLPVPFIGIPLIGIGIWKLFT